MPFAKRREAEITPSRVGFSCDVCTTVYRDRSDLVRHQLTTVHQARAAGLLTPPRSRCGVATSRSNQRRRAGPEVNADPL